MRFGLLTGVILFVFVLGIHADICLLRVVPEDFNNIAHNISFVTHTLDEALDQLELGNEILVQILEGEYDILGRSLVLSEGSIIEGKNLSPDSMWIIP